MVVRILTGAALTGVRPWFPAPARAERPAKDIADGRLNERGLQLDSSQFLLGRGFRATPRPRPDCPVGAHDQLPILFRGSMLRPDVLPALHAAIAASADPVDGWLLFDFRGINPIMAAVVGPEIVGSRRAYVYVPRDGAPVALVHAVDAELWREWPRVWKRIVWVRREELARELRGLVGGRTVAMEYSAGGEVPYGDYVPAGTLELVRASGATRSPPPSW
jgi:hypothetical protein